MPQYTHTTFLQAKDRLASLLGDSGKVFYTDTELGLYIKEALRFWGLAAQYWRETAQISLVAGQAFYDIPTVALDASANALQSFAVTDRDIVNDIAYTLMEPPIVTWAGGWIGTEMFTLAEIVDIMARSRDDLLRQSGCLATEVSYTPTPGDNEVDLNDTTIHILRGSIQEVSSSIYPLWAIDYYQAQATVDTTIVPGVGRPKAYIVNYTPNLTVDLWPAPQNNATLRLYNVISGVTFSPTASAQPIGLPDDACWLVKYRTIDDLLSGDGLARAPELAQYCEQRWLDGLDLLAQYQSIIWADVAGKRLTVHPLSILDTMRPTWQSATQSIPKSIHMLSWNLFSVYPVPDQPYTITMDIVRKAPMPTSDGSYLQIGREQLQAIYDYAQHIASFKLQGQESAATASLYKSVLEAAAEHQAAIAGSSINWRDEMMQAKSDRIMRPYRRRELVDDVAKQVKEI